MRPRSELIGRQGEVTLVDSHVSQDGAAVLLAGDAGVGKSRLLAELAVRWRGRGMTVLSGECLPLTEPMPLLPLVDALRRLGADGGEALREALESAPDFVLAEVLRLVPGLVPLERQAARGAQGNRAAGPVGDGPPEVWRRERLYAAIVELVGVLRRRSPVVLTIEDLQWADQSTLDLLTFLRVRASPPTLLTYRTDEPEVPGHVQRWLAESRRSGLIDVRLAPLDRRGTGRQLALLSNGNPVPEALVESIHSASEGNPFYTEQLFVGLSTVSREAATEPALPVGLSEVLRMRVSGLPEHAQAVLDALAVAGRPLPEDMLPGATGLDAIAVTAGLRCLRGRLLLQEANHANGVGIRHALLSQVARGRLLSHELRAAHARLAAAMQRCDDGFAAGAALHWQEAGNPDRALPAAVAAAEYAEGLLAYAEAARSWQCAATLTELAPDAATELALTRPALLIRAIDALEAAGRSDEAESLVERCLSARGSQKAHDAAVLLSRSAHFHLQRDAESALPILEAALELFTVGPPSREQAEAYLQQAVLVRNQGKSADTETFLKRARDIAQTVGAHATEAKVLANQAYALLMDGRPHDALRVLEAGRTLSARAEQCSAGAGPGEWIENCAFTAYWHLGRLEECLDAAMAGYRIAEARGRAGTFSAAALLSNAVDALIEAGRVTAAAHLLQEHSQVEPAGHQWPLRVARSAVDLRQGRLDAAESQLCQVMADDVTRGDLANTRELLEALVEVQLWQRKPAEALRNAEKMLRQLPGTDEADRASQLLCLAVRAAADLTEVARARRDRPGEASGHRSGQRLRSLAEALLGARLHERDPQEAAARVSADVKQWRAELGRLQGDPDPGRWQECAEAWLRLGRPHRAAYAWWRTAEAFLVHRGNGLHAQEALRQAVCLADEFQPLRRRVEQLAARARLDLASPPEPTHPNSSEELRAQAGPQPSNRFGLSDRERQVLSLLCAGHTNAQIGRALYISPKTVSVHVTNILRKLEVDNRTHAATVAERAGLTTDQ